MWGTTKIIVMRAVGLWDRCHPSDVVTEGTSWSSLDHCLTTCIVVCQRVINTIELGEQQWRNFKLIEKKNKLLLNVYDFVVWQIALSDLQDMQYMYSAPHRCSRCFISLCRAGNGATTGVRSPTTQGVDINTAFLYVIIVLSLRTRARWRPIREQYVSVAVKTWDFRKKKSLPDKCKDCRHVWNRPRILQSSQRVCQSSSIGSDISIVQRALVHSLNAASS